MKFTITDEFLICSAVEQFMTIRSFAIKGHIKAEVYSVASKRILDDLPKELQEEYSARALEYIINNPIEIKKEAEND